MISGRDGMTRSGLRERFRARAEISAFLQREEISSPRSDGQSLPVTMCICGHGR